MAKLSKYFWPVLLGLLLVVSIPSHYQMIYPAKAKMLELRSSGELDQLKIKIYLANKRIGENFVENSKDRTLGLILNSKFLFNNQQAQHEFFKVEMSFNGRFFSASLSKRELNQDLSLKILLNLIRESDNKAVS